MISLMDLKEARRRLNAGFLVGLNIVYPLFNKSQLQKKDSVLLEFLIYEKLSGAFSVIKASLEK